MKRYAGGGKYKLKTKINDQTIALKFMKPAGFEHQKGNYVVFKLCNPKALELDLPYRWLPIVSAAEEPTLPFQIALANNGFSKNCNHLEVGEEVLVKGPMH